MRSRKALNFVIDAAHPTTEEVDGLEAKATSEDEERSQESDGGAAARDERPADES